MAKKQVHLFLFAGEPSGDLHGSHLMKALKSRLPDVRFTGVGGPLMRAEGLECLFPSEEFEMMGFTAVLKQFPKLWKRFHIVRDQILNSHPDALICIDYPGWNIRLGQSLRKKGFKKKIVQYISPTVWAVGKNRVHKLASAFDLLLTIFPFEKECYANTSLSVTYVGHPLMESIDSYQYQPLWRESLEIGPETPLLAIFPGSRLEEVQRNLPKQLEVASQLRKAIPEYHFGISCARKDYHPIIKKMASQHGLDKNLFVVPKDQSYDLMKHSHVALAKSGTVTLELALHEKPTVVTYEVSYWNRLIAKYILRLKLPFFCMVNILLNKQVFPEFIREPYTSKEVVEELLKWERSKNLRKECIQECQKLSILLGRQSASEQAAIAIQELL